MRPATRWPSIPEAAGATQQSNTISSLRAQLPAGSYRLQYLRATCLPAATTRSSTLSRPAIRNPAPPSALNFGDQLNRALTDASCRTSLGLSDLYTFTLPSAGTVDLEIDSTSFDTVLAIRDSKDNLIVRDDEVNGLSVAHITADLPAGVYTLVGAATSGAGNYQLTAKFTAHDIPACTFAQSLDLNGGYIQRLGPRSCIGVNGQPVDYYTFTLSADSLVLAVMTSSEVDGYLTLYDSNGNVVRSDDSSYGSNDPLDRAVPPRGNLQAGRARGLEHRGRPLPGRFTHRHRPASAVLRRRRQQ